MNVEAVSGRALDALVAQRLFGLQVRDRTNLRTGEQDAVYNVTPQALAPSWVRVPEYSCSLTPSILVENALLARGWRRHVPPPGLRPPSVHTVTVILRHRDGRRVEAAGMLETALCRAALKAVEHT